MGLTRLLPAYSNASLSYDDWIEAQGYRVVLNLRETSGTTPANDGALAGLTFTWIPGTGAVGQTDSMGEDEAYSFDGADSRITIGSNATLAGFATQKLGFLVKIDTLGESNLAHLWAAQSGAGGSNQNYLLMQATNRLACSIDSNGGTDAAAISSNNTISDVIGSGEYAAIFADFDDTDALGFGRRIRLHKGVAGTLTKLALGTDTAMTSTVRAMTGLNYAVGNNFAGNYTLNGGMGAFIWDDSLWSDAEMLALMDYWGVGE